MKGGTLANIGQALAGYGSALSGNPMFLQNALMMREINDQRMAAQEQRQNQAALASALPSMLDGSGTPATRSFEVNGKTYGKDSPGAPMLDRQNTISTLLRLGGPNLVSPLASQVMQQLFPQGFSGTLGEGEVAFENGRQVAAGPAKAQDRKLPEEVENAMFLTGGNETEAREYLKQRQGQSQADTGLNPIYGRDANGNTVVMQPTKSGQLIRSAVPEGINPIAPGDLAYEKALGASGGRADAEKSAQAPAVIATAQASLRNIRDLKNHPALSSALGVVQGRLPAIAGEQADVVARMEQIGGQAFLQAFDTLKGGGQITETEGAKATAAIARLNRMQSPRDYKAALTELEEIIETGLERARRGVRVGAQGQASGATGGWSITLED